jgi:hypothetical protein
MEREGNVKDVVIEKLNRRKERETNRSTGTEDYLPKINITVRTERRYRARG